MTLNDNSEAKLFGFRISRTGIIILFFISLTICLQFIPELYYFSAMIIYDIINSTFPEILANIAVLIQMIVIFFILFTLISFLIAILILCAKTQKSLRSEDIAVRWIFFKLTKESLAVLFVLSLVYILINSYMIYTRIDVLRFYISHGILEFSMYVIHQFIYLIGELVLMVINIYTIIVCVKNRETLR